MACRLTQTAARRSVVSRAGLRVVAASAKPSKRSNDRATQVCMLCQACSPESGQCRGSQLQGSECPVGSLQAVAALTCDSLPRQLRRWFPVCVSDTIA